MLIALLGEAQADNCRRCGTLWRADLNVWLHLDPSGGDCCPRKLGPRSFLSEFRYRLAPA